MNQGNQKSSWPLLFEEFITEPQSLMRFLSNVAASRLEDLELRELIFTTTLREGFSSKTNNEKAKLVVFRLLKKFLHGPEAKQFLEEQIQINNSKYTLRESLDIGKELGLKSSQVSS